MDMEREKAIERTNQYRKCTMTVQDLYDKLGEFIRNGDGDAMIDVDDNFGGSYPMPKSMNIYVSHANEETHGKWCMFSGY